MMCILQEGQSRNAEPTARCTVDKGTQTKADATAPDTVANMLKALLSSSDGLEGRMRGGASSGAPLSC